MEFRASRMEFRIPRAAPRIPRNSRELREWPFHSESVLPEIGWSPGSCIISCSFLMPSHGHSCSQCLVCSGLHMLDPVTVFWGARFTHSPPFQSPWATIARQRNPLNSVHTRCIVKTGGFTRGVCKIGDFIKFKGFLWNS